MIDHHHQQRRYPLRYPPSPVSTLDFGVTGHRSRAFPAAPPGTNGRPLFADLDLETATLDWKKAQELHITAAVERVGRGASRSMNILQLAGLILPTKDAGSP